ncbi:MAG: formate--tetrahydrofolate ligase [Planctomycetota bacterium]|jgi:formate--tetrahydrofolate ligase
MTSLPAAADGSDVTAPRPISEIAASLQIDPPDAEPFGWYAAKLPLNLPQRLNDRPVGRYVGVTAINPTPFGEGKTVVSIGLSMGLARLGQRSIATLRQPSLAPVFGVKGGGAGSGRSRLLPAEAINLHFTGDLHAVAAANNLLAAMLDNHTNRELTPRIDPKSISWRRVVDISDKGLAKIETGLNQPRQAPQRETGFDLTAASEVMSILSLATDLDDLRSRIDRIVVARDVDGAPVTAAQIGAAGAMTVLLRDALRPNLVQTCEHSPALVHAGPFANISHGNSSIIADLAAVRLADFVVTESGFGSDLGAEKFFNIKCRASGLRPDAEVLVCTVRALKYHSGQFDVRPGHPLPDALLTENLPALRAGLPNLQAHLDNLKNFGLPGVVAINRFPTDTDREISLLRELASDAGAVRVAVIDAFARGGAGAEELADAVINVCQLPSQFDVLYPLEMSPEEKIASIATRVYGAADVQFSELAQAQLREFSELGYGNLPVCMAKTQYSLSHDRSLTGRPTGFCLPIEEVRLAAGAGFLYAMTQGISLMPGLPRSPAALKFDVSPGGDITGF